MSKPFFLYCSPGSEILYLSPEEVRHTGYEGPIEQWTVADNADLMLSAERLIEYLIESTDEVTEGWWVAAENAVDDEVRLLFQGAINQFANRIKFWMADKKVGEVE